MPGGFDVEQAPRVIASAVDEVYVEYRCFFLQESVHFGCELTLQGDDPIMTAGPGGAIFGSAGNDHFATVAIELWNAEPPGRPEGWERNAEGRIPIDEYDAQLRLASPTGGTTPIIIEPGSAGEYAIRAFVKGRQDAASRGEGQLFAGVETWLLQIWRLDDTPET